MLFNRQQTALGTLAHLDWLEAEAIHILREVAGQCSNPVLLFSGGKDSICLVRLAEKAFRPGRFPFPLLHIDTGHNYPEVIAFRDRKAVEIGERLIVRSVEDSMQRGTVVLKHVGESRNKHQSVTLLEAIEEHGFDACIGGARRDEEKARAKERIMSFYFTHNRPIVYRQGSIVPVTDITPAKPGENIIDLQVRFRTVGDITCTAPVISDADSIEKIIAETATTTITERGATRLDDQASEAAMEQRKKEGYF
jgi:sulfate adenylyltransferase subunit 2